VYYQDREHQIDTGAAPAGLIEKAVCHGEPWRRIYAISAFTNLSRFISI